MFRVYREAIVSVSESDFTYKKCKLRSVGALPTERKEVVHMSNKELRFLSTDVLVEMRNVVEDFIEDAAVVASSDGPQADDALNDMKEACVFLRKIVEELHSRRSRWTTASANVDALKRSL